AAGERRLDVDPTADRAAGEPLGRFVLMNVAGLERSDGYLANTCRSERANIVSGQDLALADNAVRVSRGVREDRPVGFSQGDWSKFHATASLGACCSVKAPRVRRAPITCASIATAISAGDWAPIASPIGAAMRARSASETPRARRRSSRRPCVFRLPSAP